MRFGIFIFLVITFSACTKSKLDYAGYLNYLADQDNGLLKETALNGVKIKVKYLPEEYLLYNALKNEDSLTERSKKELMDSYSNSLTFMLTLGPDENQKFNITRLDIHNYEEFAKRIQTMSFEMRTYIKLKIKDKTYSPDLVQLESLNGPEPSRNFIVVFKAMDETGKKITVDDLYFIYTDEMFYTGTSKFRFKQSDITALPQLIF